MRMAKAGSPAFHGRNTATGTLWPTAAFSAIFIASEVLPIDGRPAMMTASAACRPEVRSSRSLNPVDTPVIDDGERVQLIDAIDRLGQQPVDRLELAAAVAGFTDIENAFLRRNRAAQRHCVHWGRRWEALISFAAWRSSCAPPRVRARSWRRRQMLAALGVLYERPEIGEPARGSRVRRDFSSCSETVTTSAGLLVSTHNAAMALKIRRWSRR